MLKLLTPPAEEPVDLDAVKLHCRVDGNGDDPLLGAFIGAARELAEGITGRCFVSRRMEFTLDSFPVQGISLPVAPLVSVERIDYVDAAGVVQELSAAAYTVFPDDQAGIVVPAYGEVWPVTRRQPQAVRVIFNAGYGAAVDVPQAIKQWLLLTVGGWYAHRESVALGVSLAEVPRGFYDALLDPYRIVRLC